MSRRNAEVEDCIRRNTVGVHVPCDHAGCWDPDECRDYTWEERNDTCRFKTISAKADECTTCGKVFRY